MKSWFFDTLDEAETHVSAMLKDYGGEATIEHLEDGVDGWEGPEGYRLTIRPKIDIGLIYHGIIKGSYVSMKNGRRIVPRRKGFASIKKQKALNWESLAMLQIRHKGLPYEGPVALIADFYYDSVRADLDENLLKDMLQLKKPGKPCLGIIKDDNQVKVHFTRWHLDKLNPRVVFYLLDLEAWQAASGPWTKP